jgi:hypothetical protein
MAASLTFSDILADFPYKRSLSDHYSQAKAESSAWLQHYHPFEEDEYRRFNLCDFSEILTQLHYPVY